MKMDLSVLRHLAMVAASDDTKKWKLAAALACRGKIYSIGVNQYKTNPFQAKYARKEGMNCMHAEVAAIRNFLRSHKLDDLGRMTMYVCRVKRISSTNKAFTWGNSCPCSGCMRAIEDFSISRVVHSLEGVDNFNILG